MVMNQRAALTRRWRGAWPLVVGLVVGCSQGEIGGALEADPDHVTGGGHGGQSGGSGGSSGSSSQGGTSSGGQATAGSGNAGMTSVPGTPDTPMRRLSNFEYNNIVRDLLGTSQRPGDGFVNQDSSGVFDNNLTNLNSSEPLSQQYLEAAEKLADEATQPDRIGKLLACDAASASDDCVRAGLSAFAARAYRRPLEAPEVDALMTTYGAGKADGVVSGVQLAVTRVLASPYFLFWNEIGVAGAQPDSKSQVQLTPYEVASRLARLLTASMPDAELTAAAAAGLLATPEQRLTQAARLLRGPDGQPTPAARAMVDHFHAQWLDLEVFDTMNKTVDGFDPSLGSAMRAGTEAFLRSLVWEQRDVGELLTADYAFMEAKVAALYGISGVAEGEPVKVPFEAAQKAQRAGLLMQPGVLALMAEPNRSSPIQRAKFILSRIVCAPPGSPPNNAPKNADDGIGNTARERLENLTQPSPCNSCHEQLNGLGFPFDQFDTLGRFRTVDDEGKPLDTTGALVGLGAGVDGPVKDALEAMGHLAKSEQVKACLVEQWFRYASGRFEKSADAPMMSRMQQRLQASGHLEDILLAVVADDEFTKRVVAP